MRQALATRNLPWSPWNSFFQWEPTSFETFFSPAVDLTETDEAFKIHADLPGLKPEQVEIELDGQTLKISGERKYEKDAKAEGQYFSERSYGKFQRVFELPRSVDAEKIEAKFSNGELMITVPKAEAAKSRKIEIK